MNSGRDWSVTASCGSCERIGRDYHILAQLPAMTGRFRLLRSTGFAVASALSRIILAVTVVGFALLGFALLAIPATAAFVAMEWARARRWFAAR